MSHDSASSSLQHALCVRVFWGTRRLATHLVSDADRPVRLSPYAGAHVQTLRGSGEFYTRREGFHFTFSEGLRGERISSDGARQTLSALVEQGAAAETRGGWALRVAPDERVCLRSGSLRVEAQLVTRPKRPRLGLDDLLDYRWLNVLLGCLFVAALGLAEADAWAVTAVDADVSSTAATRLRQVLLVDPPRAVPIARGQPTPASSPAIAVAPAHLRPAPGDKRPPAGVAGARPHPALGDLLAGLGAAGQGVFGPSGLGGELTHAIGNLGASRAGLSGLPLRGGPSGGGGQETVGIGVPQLHHPGAAPGGALCPPGGCKSAVVPRLDEVPPPESCTTDAGEKCFDAELIRQVIHAHLQQVRYCYERSLTRNPALQGRVVMAFHVTSDGTVDLAQVSRGLVSDLDECLRGRVQLWKFPASHLKAGFRVTYPFVFRRTS